MCHRDGSRDRRGVPQGRIQGQGGVCHRGGSRNEVTKAIGMVDSVEAVGTNSREEWREVA